MAYNMYVCPDCRKVFKINGAGKKAKCPKCGDTLLVDTNEIEDDWKTYNVEKRNSIITAILDEPEVIEVEEEEPVSVFQKFAMSENTEGAQKTSPPPKPITPVKQVNPQPTAAPAKPTVVQKQTNIANNASQKSTSSSSSFFDFDDEPVSGSSPFQSNTSIFDVGNGNSGTSNSVNINNPSQQPPISIDSREESSDESLMSKIDKYGKFYGIGLTVLVIIGYFSDPPFVTLLLSALIIAGAIFCLVRKYKLKGFSIFSIVVASMYILSALYQASTIGLFKIPTKAEEEAAIAHSLNQNTDTSSEDTSYEDTSDDESYDIGDVVGDVVGNIGVSYEDIYNEYSPKLKNEYERAKREMDETINSGADINTLADKCAELTDDLATISAEGTDKMAEIANANPLTTNDYMNWSTKLNSEYMNYGTQLSSQYMQAGTNAITEQMNNFTY